MARNLKHVGQLINTQRRVIVVFREIPNEPDKCLVVDTDALKDWMHDDVINAVESTGAQASPNFYQYAERAVFTDGSNMLQSLHKHGLLQKVSTDNVMMVPNSNTKIRLNELNAIIAEQTGEPAVVNTNETALDKARTEMGQDTNNNDVVSDTAMAQNLLSQAEQFEAEAKRLREQAFEMEPSLKPKRGRKPKVQPA